MCYLGIGNTFTPCHKDLCASSGQNLMCYTENGGSSFWFMTATKDIFVATEYFHSIKQELDHERHIITLEQLIKAPFDVYVAEQKLGDLVLVPSRSCHQVVNQGGISIKTSWSRMTLDGLTAAYYHELPIYQRFLYFYFYSAPPNPVVLKGLSGGNISHQIHCVLCHQQFYSQIECKGRGRNTTASEFKIGNWVFRTKDFAAEAHTEPKASPGDVRRYSKRGAASSALYWQAGLCRYTTRVSSV